MKNAQLSLLILLLHATGFEAKGFTKNVPTYEIGPGAKVNGNKITYDEPDCDAGLDCTTTKTCSKAGYSPSLSEDKKYFACCAAGQRLLGSPETAFDCCASGHDLVGDSHCGYHCCPTGFTFDGNQCKEFCKNGKALVDGKCVCPKGTAESADGTCEKQSESGDCDDGECSSGLESGKCYTFKADNGNRLGLGGDGNYYAATDGMTQRYGKFQLCLDEKCAAGQEINPSDEVYIRDTYGDLATGANRNQWLLHAPNGVHISRTPLFSAAGHFSISKWPCGKYCLGGVTEGVGPACPAEIPALTFYTQDPQMCVEFEFTEVPCDIHSKANNCIWKGGNQCCNKVDCSKASCSKTDPASNTSIPVSASPHSLSQDISPNGASLEGASSPDNISSDNIPSDSHQPSNASPNNTPPDNNPPDSTSPKSASTNSISPGNTSPGSLDNVLPDNASNWEIPPSYVTTLLLTAASLALFAIISKLPKQRATQIIGPKDRVSQAPSPKDSVVQALPEKDDITQLSKKTSDSVSRYTAAALSRYTTKSTTVVSTSKINHDEYITSEYTENESNDTTPEEMDMQS